MPFPGELVGDRYRLDDRIAAGGMGEVWRATDTVLGRPVAVKTLLAGYAGDAGFRSRFQHEARAMASLRNNGVAPVYDFGETDEGAYLVMARVDGLPLNRWIAERGPLSVTETLSVVAQAARALAAAHAAGIVHRDVKPGNLIIEPDGHVVLVDFGVARSAQSVTLTGAKEVVGTALYIAPEQVSKRATGPAADLYSLGAVAYHCLAGLPPFLGDNPVAVAIQHLDREPPPLPASVPAPVRELVAAAMAKDPDDRFPSAIAMAEAADAAAADLRETPNSAAAAAHTVHAGLSATRIDTTVPAPEDPNSPPASPFSAGRPASPATTVDAGDAAVGATGSTPGDASVAAAGAGLLPAAGAAAALAGPAAAAQAVGAPSSLAADPTETTSAAEHSATSGSSPHTDAPHGGPAARDSHVEMPNHNGQSRHGTEATSGTAERGVEAGHDKSTANAGTVAQDSDATGQTGPGSAGATPAGTDLAGASPAGTGSAAASPAGIGAAQTGLAAASPAGTGPAGTGLAGASPVGMGAAGARTGGDDPERTAALAAAGVPLAGETQIRLDSSVTESRNSSLHRRMLAVTLGVLVAAAAGLGGVILFTDPFGPSNAPAPAASTPAKEAPKPSPTPAKKEQKEQKARDNTATGEDSEREDKTEPAETRTQTTETTNEPAEPTTTPPEEEPTTTPPTDDTATTTPPDTPEASDDSE
ncbi:protein kinase [Actinoplanes sp. NPDC024001]|uniref:serine/threonine protein kinase n=1 Tax=Actinoplanes sp. NPDC024001 TaxID=3154598 RepID=UPI0034106CDA